MMHPKKIGPRAEHRQREGQRVNESPTLAARYPELKSLTAELAYCDHEETHRGTSMKYKFNLEAAKSVFRFECSNCACVGGDFDLSQELAKAVAARRALVLGEVFCQGWRDDSSIATQRCLNILRYKLNLGFARRRTAALATI